MSENVFVVTKTILFTICTGSIHRFVSWIKKIKKNNSLVKLRR